VLQVNQSEQPVAEEIAPQIARFIANMSKHGTICIKYILSVITDATPSVQQDWRG
jgi:hypothetical protein